MSRMLDLIFLDLTPMTSARYKMKNFWRQTVQEIFEEINQIQSYQTFVNQYIDSKWSDNSSVYAREMFDLNISHFYNGF